MGNLSGTIKLGLRGSELGISFSIFEPGTKIFTFSVFDQTFRLCLTKFNSTIKLTRTLPKSKINCSSSVDSMSVRLFFFHCKNDCKPAEGGLILVPRHSASYNFNK
jgi:hypothetical protein